MTFSVTVARGPSLAARISAVPLRSLAALDAPMTAPMTALVTVALVGPASPLRLVPVRFGLVGGGRCRSCGCGLSTLLGQDEAPAELPAWDYVPAWLARHLVAGMDSAEWRYVVCGPDGRAAAGGLVKARPDGPGGRVRRDRRRGGIVEIALTTTELDELTGLAGLAGPAAGPGRRGRWQPVINAILGDHAAAANPSPDAASAPGPRVAGARLRRWVQQRDRACVHPTCQAPAASTDQDHRIDHATGGPTSADNLASTCRHDHRIKHDGGWQTELAGDGTTHWISPHGHNYASLPPPVIPPLPEPIPDSRHEHPDGWLNYPRAHCGCPGTCTCTDPILPPSPVRIKDPEPEPPPKPTFDPDDEPPF
jgi:HNH endonuclease